MSSIKKREKNRVVFSLLYSVDGCLTAVGFNAVGNRCIMQSQHDVE